MRTAALHNLGCKVNSYETEAMQQLLEEAGYEIVSFHEKADVYIINTCSVTNIADRKSRQMLHRAKKQNPEAVVVAAGCYVQSAAEELKADLAVDVIIGNNKKQDLVPILEEYFKDRTDSSHVIEINETHEYERLSIHKIADHTRAFLKVQDGCNQFCSYCIIPYTRGRVRSRKLADVVAEAKRLAENDYQEVVLTGIHLDSYGVDLEKETLLSVIQEIGKIEGIQRIRLGSLEPRIMTEEFVKGLSEEPKLCPHFHLSLQSGCDATLKRMNRKYNTEEFRQCCKRLRQYFDEPALTTDVIVGFPGETEEEFAETLTFLKEIRFYETHVFKYSRRKGTKADRMPDQIPEQVKTARSDVLLELSEQNSTIYRKRLVGRNQEILVEEEHRMSGQTFMVGHTKEYVKIVVPEGSVSAGEIVTVHVEKLMEKEGILQGKRI